MFILSQCNYKPNKFFVSSELPSQIAAYFLLISLPGAQICIASVVFVDASEMFLRQHLRSANKHSRPKSPVKALLHVLCSNVVTLAATTAVKGARGDQNGQILGP